MNRVQTYCGLEIAIMQIRPSPNWIQRVAGLANGSSMLAAESLMCLTPRWLRGPKQAAGHSCEAALPR